MSLIRYILVMLLAVIMASCEDDFEAKSESRITERDISGSPILAEQALKGIYASMSKGSLYGKKLSYYCSLNSDTECISGSTDNGRRAIARGVATKYNTDSKDIITNLYATIRECNNLIMAVDLGLSEANGEIKSKLLEVKAETAVLRAMLYHDMVRVFGDVPYILKNDPSGAESYTKKRSRGEILSEEISNVEKLIESLPKKQETFERIDRVSASALLAEMCMTRAGRAMSNDENEEERAEYLKKAKESLERVVESGRYELEESFEGLFKKLMSYDNNTKEIVFALPMTRGNSSELGYFISTKHEDGSKYGSTECGVLSPATYYYDFEIGDERRDVTLTLHKYTKDSQQSLSGVNNISVGKFRREWLNPVYEGKQKYTGVDLPIIRYSDVLLMLAECRLEIDKDVEGAKELVRKVRSRAVKDAGKVDAYFAKRGTYEAIVQCVRDERMYEFGGERKRKFDLMRYGILDSMLTRCKTRLVELKNRKGEFDEVPEKIYWRVMSDGERVQYASTDESPFAEDFDFNSDGLKNTKWAGAISQSFIDRMWEGESEGTVEYPE